MKNNKKIIYKLSFLLVALFVFTIGPAYAQGAKAKKKMIEVNSVVVDTAGNTVSNATIFANEGSLVVKSDEQGAFSIKASKGSTVIIEAPGYDKYTWDLSKITNLPQIELQSTLQYTGKSDMVVLPMNHEVEQRYLVGAVSVIDGKKLEKYSDPLLTNTLQGMASGLNVMMQSGGMANNPATINVRGLSRNSNNTPIYIVDGIERTFDDLNPEEIDKIEVLKDASAKILYGSRAANGVVLVTTRRGEAHKRVIDAKVDYGVGLPTFMPEFLNSYQYSKLYNEARENDGYDPIYSQSDIDGYENSTGENDLLYPDVDYYDYFLRSFTTYQKITTEVAGGNKNARYAFMAGYMGYQGLQDVGDIPRQDRFNLRSNLDIDFNDIISGYINMSVIMDSWKFSGLDHANTFSALTSHRPNEYPLTIDEKYIEESDKGVPALGGSDEYPRNLLGSMKYEGDGNNQFINQQMTTGLNFDLNSLIEGLSAETFIAFDNYFYGQQKIEPKPATYVPTAHPYINDSVIFRLVQEVETDKEYNLTGDQTLRTTAFNAKVKYNKSFGNSLVKTSAGYFYYLKEEKGFSQDIENDNAFLNANFVSNKKYIVDANISYMGSNRFVKNNRHFLSYAVGAAWILSEEAFMSNGAFDFLKLKTSYGLLGYDAATAHYLFENRWESDGNVRFGEQNNGDNRSITKLNAWGNPDLGWEKSREINIGLEGLLFNKHLAFELNYYNEYRYDMITVASSLYPAYYGPFKYNTNFEEVTNNGIELSANWINTVGEFSYRVGLNINYYKNNFKVKDETDYSDKRAEEGKPTDVIMGYESMGLFGKDVDMDNTTVQTFGPYKNGDIAYVDQNNDGLIDDLDKIVVGNKEPRSNIGLDIELKYKNWGLYALGTGSFGVYKNITNTYYQNNGTSKYSVLANKAYHATRNPDGEMPRLTSTEGKNNTVDSDFWTQRADFFRLKNIELSYTLGLQPSNVVKQAKIFVRGNNLFVISNINDVDPEAPNAGIGNYPVLRMITGGISVSF